MEKDKGLKLTPAAMAAAAKGDFANFLVAATPGGIEAQEARGQTELVCSDILPIQCNDFQDKPGTREVLEHFGVKFGELQDDLFVNVELPPGWVKEATDHSMWSYLVDDKGRKRARIFYKAAFYDRSAHMSANGYHSIESEKSDDGKQWRYFVLTADGERLFTGEWCQYGDHDGCQKWLDENRPGWKDRTKYWTE